MGSFARCAGFITRGIACLFESGLVVGVHLGGISDQFNVAIPSFELAKDDML